ncbi:MAG: PotD/PotF family extracellular solute-binding protein [Dongiaceae bacterium]
MTAERNRANDRILPKAGSGLVHFRVPVPMTRRSFGKGMLAAGAAGALGFGARPAAAATEVRYNGWQGLDASVDAGGWLAKNDITLQATYINSNEEIIAAAQAGGIGQMDIVTPDAYFLPAYLAGDLLQELDLSRIPNFANVFPQFQNSPGISKDGKYFALPNYWGSCPLMWNADLVQGTPDSWHDLFRPEFKGKTAIVEDVIAATMSFAMAATGRSDVYNLTQEELDKTIDLLIKFKKEQALTIAPSWGDLASMFANEEIVIAIGWEPCSIWGGADAKNIKWAVPKEGAINFVGCFAMVRDAPNVDADYLILNQSLAPEAQAANANEAFGVITADAVPLLTPEQQALYPYGDIPSYFEASGGATRLYPIESDGTHVTYDQVLDGWEKFQRA